MKNYLYLLVVVSLLFVGNVHVAEVFAQATCEQAMQGTCGHFDTGGDGAGEHIHVDTCEDYCSVLNTDLDILCEFDQLNCPNPAPIDVDGHDIADVVTCDKCGGYEPFTGSVNQAKCCLIRGEPYGPNGETICAD